MRLGWRVRSALIEDWNLSECYQVCYLASLRDPGSQGFVIDGLDGTIELFVVRRGDLLAAYRNSCPHTGANLEWQADQFLDLSRSY
jgi:nitrite reductase/ring-hydroxylating ferredoxin subunit